MNPIVDEGIYYVKPDPVQATLRAFAACKYVSYLLLSNFSLIGQRPLQPNE
jgi:hypothetical protein